MKIIRSNSLRIRLLIGTSISTFLVLAVLGLAIYFSMKHSLTEQFDDALRLKAKAVIGMVEQKEGKVQAEFDPQQMQDFTKQKSADYFEVILADGSLLAKSESLGSDRLDITDKKKETNLPIVGECILPNGKRGRILRQEFTPYIEADELKPYNEGKFKSEIATIYLASRTKNLNEILESLQWLLFGLTGSAILVVGSTLVWVVSKTLQPVKMLANRIDQLKQDNLSERINIPEVPSELAPIVDRLNQLIRRLEAAFNRERSFTADVAHELRTPLAGIRSMLQVTRTRERLPAEYESTIDKCLAVNTGLQSMVGSLLELARADAGELVVHRRFIDLSALLEICLENLTDQAKEKDISIQRSVPQNVMIESDVDKLQIVLRNVLDNAISHTPQGGSVQIELKTSVKSDKLGATLQVINQPVDLRPEMMTQIFERFWQGDISRTSVGRHSGLGLPLCQNLSKLIGAKLSAELVGSAFVLRLGFDS